MEPMIRSHLLAGDHDKLIEKLAQSTEGWTGADLAGLVRSAASFAVDRALDDDGELLEDVKLTPQDFEAAREETVKDRETSPV
jgi:SpoVK/Ycf46/Vps4 family AAA+-type ATPase